MSIDKTSGVVSSWKALSGADKATFSLWLFVGLLLIVDSLYFPGGSVVFNYLEGALRWKTTGSLYDGPEGYLYLPQFAMIFSVLPDNLAAAEIIWNLFQLVIVVSGLFLFSRMMANPSEKSFFPLLSIAVLIISWTTIRNGQATMIQLGLMLWSIVALVNKQWALATFALIAGLITKPVFIVFFLVVVFFHYSLYWRLLIGFLIAFSLPILFKGFSYGVEQHIEFVSMAREAAAYGEDGHKTNWAHFFAIFPQIWGVWVPSKIQLVTRLVSSLLVLLAVAFARKHYSPAMAYYYLYAFAACYLMLFNPRTETNSFALIAPAIGYWLAVSRHRFSNLQYHIFCWFLVISFPFAKYVKLITPGMWAWGKPLITVVFTVFLVQQLILRCGEAKDADSLKTT